jgi:hypothetical protein
MKFCVTIWEGSTAKISNRSEREEQVELKFQIPSTEIQNKKVSVIGYWGLELIWNLEFGAWCFIFPLRLTPHSLRLRIFWRQHGDLCPGKAGP